MSLFELIITLSICILFYAASFRNMIVTHNKMAAKQSVSLVFQVLHFARHSAHTLDRSVYLSQSGSKVFIHTPSLPGNSVLIPLKSSVSINNLIKSVGFTSHQTTSRVGTVSINDGGRFNDITIGIGHGQINIK